MVCIGVTSPWCIVLIMYSSKEFLKFLQDTPFPSHVLDKEKYEQFLLSNRENKPISREAERLRRYRARKKLRAAATKDANQQVSICLIRVYVAFILFNLTTGNSSAIAYWSDSIFIQ